MNSINFFKTLTLIGFLLYFNVLSAQFDKERKADSLYKVSLEHIKSNDYDKGISLLKEANNLDRDNNDIIFELANSFYKIKQYNKSIKYLKQISETDLNDDFYILAIHVFTEWGKDDKAFKYMHAGLKNSNNPGKIYNTYGNALLKRGDWFDAYYYFEEGINVEPTYLPNYIDVANLYFDSPKMYWGFIYGELCMNLDTLSECEQHFSKLIYNTYMSCIKIDNNILVVKLWEDHFGRTGPDIMKTKLMFLQVYDESVRYALKEEKKIDIHALVRMRKQFIWYFYQQGYQKTFSIVLFNYHKKLIESGHFEAYSYWILKSGDPQGFEIWKKDNLSKWKDFNFWFKSNRLIIDHSNKFYRDRSLYGY